MTEQMFKVGDRVTAQGCDFRGRPDRYEMLTGNLTSLDASSNGHPDLASINSRLVLRSTLRAAPEEFHGYRKGERVRYKNINNVGPLRVEGASGDDLLLSREDGVRNDAREDGFYYGTPVRGSAVAVERIAEGQVQTYEPKPTEPPTDDPYVLHRKKMREKHGEQALDQLLRPLPKKPTPYADSNVCWSTSADDS